MMMMMMMMMMMLMINVYSMLGTSSCKHHEPSFQQAVDRQSPVAVRKGLSRRQYQSPWFNRRSGIDLSLL